MPAPPPPAADAPEPESSLDEEFMAQPLFRKITALVVKLFDVQQQLTARKALEARSKKAAGGPTSVRESALRRSSLDSSGAPPGSPRPAGSPAGSPAGARGQMQRGAETVAVLGIDLAARTDEVAQHVIVARLRGHVQSRPLLAIHGRVVRTLRQQQRKKWSRLALREPS